MSREGGNSFCIGLTGFYKFNITLSTDIQVRLHRLAKDAGSQSLVQFEFVPLNFMQTTQEDLAYFVTFSYPMSLADVSSLLTIIF